MLNQITADKRPDVLLVDDADLSFTVTRRGRVRNGQACQLTVIVNGHDALSFLEDAGGNAPQSAVIAVTVPDENRCSMVDAMRTRPWRHDDVPVIYFACTSPTREGHLGSRIGYLVKNGVVTDMFDTIRATLDIDHGQH